MKIYVYYNSDLDDLFLVDHGDYVAWQVKDYFYTTSFCRHCKFWHLIGEL